MNKRHSNHSTTPNGISFRLVLLAFALLVAQPAHWMTCCLATMPDLHLAAANWSAETGRHDHSMSHELEDREAAMHGTAQSGVHNEAFVISPHCIRVHHHHAPCCSDCKAPALSQRSERTGAGTSQLIAFDAVAVPVFRLDVLEGRCTRAGPVVPALISSHFVSSLCGRAPPRFA